MKPKIYLLLFVFIPFISSAVHYRTLINGNWNNLTTVWSTNGISPCGCAPSVNLLSDTVTLNHPINLTAHLSANAFSKLQINQNGNLTNSLFDVSISNSILVANGSMNIKKLTIQNGGAFSIAYSVLMLNGSSNINGQFNANSSSIYILAGNLDVSSTGQFNLTNGTKVQVTNGNIKNNGNLSICANCCITFDRGGINNESSGQVIGDGATLTYNGNFKNLNSWSTGIDYCSTGTDQGMTTAENCITTNEICLNSPLADYVANFIVAPNGNANSLSWEVLNEGIDHFIIQKSQNAFEWSLFTKLSADHENPQHTFYTWKDETPFNGINYYRLSVIDFSSDTISQAITSINRTNEDGIFIYPNPTDQSITLSRHNITLSSTIYLYSTIGQLIGTYYWPSSDESYQIELPPLNGVYFITIMNSNEIQHFKIRKTGE